MLLLIAGIPKGLAELCINWIFPTVIEKSQILINPEIIVVVASDLVLFSSFANRQYASTTPLSRISCVMAGASTLKYRIFVGVAGAFPFGTEVPEPLPVDVPDAGLLTIPGVSQSEYNTSVPSYPVLLITTVVSTDPGITKVSVLPTLLLVVVEVLVVEVGPRVGSSVQAIVINNDSAQTVFDKFFMCFIFNELFDSTNIHQKQKTTNK